MNKRQFIGLFVLVIVIGGYGLIRYRKGSASWSGTPGGGAGQKVLGDFNLNDVAQIGIKKSDTGLTLHKVGGIWTVAERNDYPAGFAEISEFIIKMHDLKAGQTI